MKKIISIAIFSTCVLVSAAQVADTSYNLLWYKGKKIKENVLFTPKGGIVTYSTSKRSINVSSKSGEGKQMDDMLAELGKTPQRIVEITGHLMKKLPKNALPPVLYNVSAAYNRVNEEYTSALGSEINIPDLQLPEEVLPTLGHGPSQGTYEITADPIDKLIVEMHQYMNVHKEDKFTALLLPVPPKFDYTYCYSCDIEKKEAYKKALEKFKKELAEVDEDIAIIKKAYAASHQAHLTRKGASNETIQKELNEVIVFIWERTFRKMMVLMEKYFNDPERCPALLQVALSVERQFQIAGAPVHFPEGYYLQPLKTMAQHIGKAMDEKDYTIALNLQLILSIERQFQLFTGATIPDDLLAKALQFNQFKLNMDISAKISGNGGYQLVQVKGNNWFSAIPDSSCRLKWILIGPYADKTKMDLIAAEIKGSGRAIMYTGTKVWNSNIPSIKVDFCKIDDRIDSITAYPFYAEGHKEIWNIPGKGPANVSLAATVLMGCFVDEARSYQDAAKFSNSANVEKIKKEMMEQYNEMMKNYKAGNMTMPASGADLTRLSRMAAGVQNSNIISELMHSAKTGRYIFEPVVHNRETLILKEKLNGKEIFPRNTATEYANFPITLEHDPGGPYPIEY
jgi:hypothetical protein